MPDLWAELQGGGYGPLLQGVQFVLGGAAATDEFFVRLAAVEDGCLQGAGALLQKVLQPPGRVG